MKKLTVHLPEYQRVLDVVTCIVESGLYVRDGPANASSPQNAEYGVSQLSRQHQQQRFYFEECQRLERALSEAHALAARTAELHRKEAGLGVREQICRLLPQLREDEPLEKEELFLAFLRTDMELLACLACGEVLKHFFQHPKVAKKRFFYDMLMKQLDAVETKRVLQEIANTRLGDFRSFVRENLEAMDAILMDASLSMSADGVMTITPGSNVLGGATRGGATASQPLFHRLIERHPSEFAAILWHSPFLTAQIFQVRVKRNGECVRGLQSGGLTYSLDAIRSSTITGVPAACRADPGAKHPPLLASTAPAQRLATLAAQPHAQRQHRGAGRVLGEPSARVRRDTGEPADGADGRCQGELLDPLRCDSDRLMQLSVCAASEDFICVSNILVPASTELLLSCRSTFAEVLLSTPETMGHILKTTPDLLALILRDEPSLLALAFSLVPHLLSETLEKHPEFFLDVAHRRPVLVTRLFSKHPDLLMEPLEANPTLFSNFLVYHRDALPDLSAPDFNPLLFQIESKKFASASTQTSKNLFKSVGTLRIREQIELQEAEMVALARLPLTSAGAADPLPPSLQRKRSEAIPEPQDASGVTSTAASSEDASAGVADSSPLLTPSSVVQEIARLYVKKIHADEQDDVSRRTRRELVAFIKDTYLVELGFKAAAHKKLAQLLLSASRSGHTQEKVRIKWFLRFVHMTPKLRLHHVALDFYLLVLQRLIPVEQLQFRLEDEPYHVCSVAASTFAELVDETLISRLLASKEQRRQLLLLQVSERDSLLGSSGEVTASASSGPGAVHARRRDSVASVQLQHSSAPVMLHVDDILDSTMNVWLQYQARCAAVVSIHPLRVGTRGRELTMLYALSEFGKSGPCCSSARTRTARAWCTSAVRAASLALEFSPWRRSN